MNIGTLTPRTSTIVDSMRFSGSFAQPDGFASVLVVRVRTSGDACLTLQWMDGATENSWSVELTDQQRNALGAMLCRYQPRTFERFEETT